jgi:hypothetical protein
MLAEAALAANLERGTTADRYQVVLHVDADAPGGAVEMNDGPSRVSAETSGRLTCDASVVVMQYLPDGSALDVGRRSRTVPVPIRRALVARSALPLPRVRLAALRCRSPGPLGRLVEVLRDVRDAARAA